MRLLIVLLATFAAALILTKLLTNAFDYKLCGRIAMSAMLLFTAMGHFAFSKGMAMMLPNFIPFKIEIIYATGLIEIIAAVALLIPAFIVWAGWGLILFFTLLLPANIKAARRHIDYQKGTFDGNGPAYLWFRVPLQVLFILWVYFSAIKF